MMKFNFLIIICLLQVLISCGEAQEIIVKALKKAETKSQYFKNPLLPSGPDPWVIKRDSFYYYMNTGGKRIEIYKTKTLSQLSKAEKKVVYNAPDTGADSKNLWAPELHVVNNKWYLYYTAGSSPDFATQRTFVLENSNQNPLEGNWVKKGIVKDDAANFFAIDATVFTTKGINYLIWSGHASEIDKTQRLYITRLREPWLMDTSRIEISAPTYEWEKIGLPHVNEGPEILMNNKGSVFLIYSASGCWTDDYSLGMLSLKENGNPLNPSDWIKSTQPVFSKKPENGAYGPGHNSFFKSPDGKEDWIIYHANSAAGQGCGDARNPRIQKFTWNSDGTPNFGAPVKINTLISNPLGE